MKIDKDLLYPYLLFSQPIKYNESITLYPVLMKDVLEFNVLSESITVRKDSRFSDKTVIKMTYLEFLWYAANNMQFCQQYDFKELNNYYVYFLKLLALVCREQRVEFNEENGDIYINGFLLDSNSFDDIRRIIIEQNGIDFDVDEFLNYDTEKSLEEAKRKQNKNQEKSTMEDYIDSLCIALNYSEEDVMKMAIRKFWRYIKRLNLHENYTILKTGECSGMVTFKEPISHWMVSIDEKTDKYADVKADETALKNKINGANS